MKSDLPELGGRKVKPLVRTDGRRLILEDRRWVCCRASGKDLAARIFSEANSEPALARLATSAQDGIEQ
jgi:phosphoglucomutase